MINFLILNLFLLIFVVGAVQCARKRALPDDFEVAVHIDPQANATAIAEQFGYENRGQIGTLKNFYEFVKRNGRKREILEQHIVSASNSLGQHPNVLWHQVQELFVFEPRNVKDIWTEPKDAKYAQQWFLHGDAVKGTKPLAHANVKLAWQNGLFGSGITLAVIDDRINWRHPDIADNYVSSLSYDYEDGDNDPSNGGGDHGTPVASTCCGVNNRAIAPQSSIDAKECGVGSAPKSNFAGVKDINVRSDSRMAQVLTHQLSKIDIYIATGGPSDNGRAIQSIGPLTTRALDDGLSNGRNGKGALYVWAAGNGGQFQDDCVFDGFVANRRTFGVGAITADGEPTYYSENCCAHMVVAPSSGAVGFPQDGINGMLAANFNGCGDDWGGTSGAAPLAAGVIALWLEAVPSLGWLDVYGVTVYSSSRFRTSSKHAASWRTNGAGVTFSDLFAFGVLDAWKGVQVARKWKNYPSGSKTDSGNKSINKVIASPKDVSPYYSEIEWTSTAPANNHLQHVEVTLSIQHSFRGNLIVELISPSGMISRLAHQRDSDSGSNINYQFTTVAFWDESPRGQWKIRMRDMKLSSANGGTWRSWRIVLYHSAGNIFSKESTRPIAIDKPPAPPVFPTPASSKPPPTPLPTVDYVVVPRSAKNIWRFRDGQRLPGEQSDKRDYIEQNGVNGEQWQNGDLPIGYGEDDIEFGTKLQNTSRGALLRTWFLMGSSQLMSAKQFIMSAASDDYATVSVNGYPVLGESPPIGREYKYWNDAREVPRSFFQVGYNLIAVELFNGAGSSDAVFDCELTAKVIAGTSWPSIPPHEMTANKPMQFSLAPTPQPTPMPPPTPFATDSDGNIIFPSETFESMSLSLPIISEAPMNIEEPPGVLDLFGIPYFVLIITAVGCCVWWIGAIGIGLCCRAMMRKRSRKSRKRTVAGFDIDVPSVDVPPVKEPRRNTASKTEQKTTSKTTSKTTEKSSTPKTTPATKPTVPKAPRDDRKLPDLKAVAHDRALPKLKTPASLQERKDSVVENPLPPIVQDNSLHRVPVKQKSDANELRMRAVTAVAKQRSLDDDDHHDDDQDAIRLRAVTTVADPTPTLQRVVEPSPPPFDESLIDELTSSTIDDELPELPSFNPELV